MDEILKYFPALSDLQREQFAQLGELYPQWNDKINVVSRKDIDNLYVNHVLHSLSIAKFITFAPGSNILDLGTGGGFPGIPLAILFPDSQFLLVDRIGKKLTVASDIAAKTGVRNVATFHGDIKEVKGEFDFVVSRAVMPAAPLFSLSRRLICRKNINSMRNGLIMLKGGDLTEELGELKRINLFVQDLSLYFTEPFFDTKKIVYIPV
ncbi:MAG: 16S rRNA (guanine(527)-N(7))-methyltransferase RsmG [Muribaculaceae bacterium]|nr:16S rRNA (guanine(527)-N(7))-methyltransferase RsmG [Muribaculaceae bacterium]